MGEKEIFASIKNLLRKVEEEEYLEDRWQTEFLLKLSESTLDKSVPSAKADFYIVWKESNSYDN